MSRKDTIIVAVLINAGLLVVLFVSSLKQEKQETVYAKKEVIVPAKKVVEPAKKEVPIAKSAPDKMDQVLAQYTKEPVQKPVIEEKVAAPKIEQPAKKEIIAVDSTPVLPKAEKKPISEDLDKVVVKRGDVLEKIAKQHGVTVGEIMEKNQLTDSKLQIGQVLLLPKRSLKVNPMPLEISDEKFYVVKDGDNLWKIAMENNVKVEELLKLNKLNEKKAKMLKPGDKLKIR